MKKYNKSIMLNILNDILKTYNFEEPKDELDFEVLIEEFKEEDRKEYIELKDKVRSLEYDIASIENDNYHLEVDNKSLRKLVKELKEELEKTNE